MNVGIDTDFLVALEIPEHPKHEKCVGLLDHLLGAGERLALAHQVLNEFGHPIPVYNRGFSATTSRAMPEIHTADLLALDTAALKGRLSELRRYL